MADMFDRENFVHFEVLPNGVEVWSSVPPMEDRWWDNPWLHIFWSYFSWGSMLLNDMGIKGPRRFFKKHMERKGM